MLLNYLPFCLFYSTLSSGLNSLPTIMWEDFVKPHCGVRFSEVKATMFGKILGKILSNAQMNKNNISDPLAQMLN